jgi:hypothetical protein
MKNILNQKYLMIVLATAMLYFFTGKLNAHCDTMDGPVVKAAQKSLETGNINYVMIWVQKSDEGEINKAFQNTLNIRKLSKEAQEMADMYFFETVVRLHRMGEGAPYTGIKPAGTDLGEVIPEADKSIEKGNTDKLTEIITNAITKGIAMHFQELMEKKNFNILDINAGREFVKAYVEFVHYVEMIYDTAVNPVEHDKH